MPKLTIEITEKAHSVLKERAKSEERSLTQYITLLLDDVTGIRHLLTTTTTTVATTTLSSEKNNTSSATNTEEEVNKNTPHTDDDNTTKKKKRSVITMDTNTEGADNLWN